MAFDESKDKTLYTSEVEVENCSIVVSVKSYNDGQPKIQIGPRLTSTDEGETRYRKLGRLTPGEAEAVIDGIQECLANIEKG